MRWIFDRVDAVKPDNVSIEDSIKHLTDNINKTTTLLGELRKLQDKYHEADNDSKKIYTLLFREYNQYFDDREDDRHKLAYLFVIHLAKTNSFFAIEHADILKVLLGENEDD